MQHIVGSYSFFNEMENCPFKAFATRVERSIQRVETQAQRWGNYVHDALEKRISEGTPLPEDVVNLEPYALCFDGKSVQTEMKLGITSEGHPTSEWKQSHVYGKIDVVLTVSTLPHIDITDWKTGKEDYETQFELELHALLHAAATAPIAARYTARYAYVGREKRPDKIGRTYDTADGSMASPQQTWAKVNALMGRAFDYQNKGHWPKTPNTLCGWCPVMKCEHNKTEARLAKEGLK